MEQWDYSCPACGYHPKPVTIIQGGHRIFTVLLIDPATKSPLDLTSATSISTCLYNADGTELDLNLTSGITILTPANLGKIQISLSAAQTALLRTVGLTPLEVAVSIASGDPVKCQIANAYIVSQSVC